MNAKPTEVPTTDNRNSIRPNLDRRRAQCQQRLRNVAIGTGNRAEKIGGGRRPVELLAGSRQVLMVRSRHPDETAKTMELRRSDPERLNHKKPGTEAHPNQDPRPNDELGISPTRESRDFIGMTRYGGRFLHSFRPPTKLSRWVS